jgi:DNA polymerase-3 subunit gamma/tau
VAQLSIKYRPGKIEDVAGNSSVKKQLKALLKRDKKDIPKVFGFFGLSGGGKTTLARIVAKELDCPASEFYELNAASMRGIDTIRDIEKQIRYSAMSGSCRIWLLDEVHQYPAASQEALLKMFEECPPHIYFMICTTNPEKLKPALKNRCVSFEVSPLTDEEMYDLLVSVVEAEESDVPDSILDKIVANASGSSRNALQMLEKLIDLSAKDMSSVALKMNEVETQVIEFCRIMMKPKVTWKEVLPLLNTLVGEYESNRHAIRGYAASILLKGDNKQAALLLDCFKDKYMDKNDFILATYTVFMG